MSRCAGALLCALLALSLCEPLLAGKFSSRSRSSSRHSYPPSRGGLSGGHSSHISPSHVSQSHSSHGYPPSGGLSGSNHGYPSSGGLSGNSHGYPSSGGGLSGNNHGYPNSGGLSGSGNKYPSSGHSYPSSGHSYPSSNQGSHGYPASHGLSGNSGSKVTTNVHHHYHYNPPQQIRYTAPGGATHNYPVYHGTPPTYVYQYKDSGSKYGTLLAGLALLNLGTLGGALYASHHSSGSSSSSNYTPKPGEICKFGVRKDNGDYEETKIKCDMITSFIWAEEAKANASNTNQTVVTTTVTNTTVVNTTDAMPMPQNDFEMLPNGTIVPKNTTEFNSTLPINGTSTSSVVTTTVTNTTHVVDALDDKLKGPPVAVTPGMQCYVIRTTPSSTLKKTVSCGLLQSYAQQSLQQQQKPRNDAIKTSSAIALIGVAFMTCFVY